jgi:spermidine/putrescine-binding protein
MMPEIDLKDAIFIPLSTLLEKIRKGEISKSQVKKLLKTFKCPQNVELKPAKMSLRLLKTSLKLGLLPKDYLVNLPDNVKSQLCSEVGSSLYVYSGDKVGNLAYSGDKVGNLAYSGDKVGGLAYSGDKVGDLAYSGDKVGDLAYSGDKVGDLAYSGDKTNKSLDYLIQWCKAHY